MLAKWGTDFWREFWMLNFILYILWIVYSQPSSRINQEGGTMSWHPTITPSKITKSGLQSTLLYYTLYFVHTIINEMHSYTNKSN